MEQIQLILTPAQSVSEEEIKKAVASSLHLPSADFTWRVVKRSVDARQRDLKVLLTVQVNPDDEPYQKPQYQQVDASSPTVAIVGAGPAGLFAALTLLEHGIKPIILERGKDVSARKVDIATLNRNEGLCQESNYCFGEGGAGTFSDGKLFSRSKKRGNMQRVMEIFHYHGAADSVLYEVHAHIGSDKLPAIIRHMRETILSHGGEVRFSTRVDALIIEDTDEGKIVRGVKTQSGETIMAEAVILAIGHSAHDTYQMLLDNGVSLEPKGFALGVRVEHPQALIDRLMYHFDSRRPKIECEQIVSQIGHAAYSLVTQVAGRGVYSFCMCPGGHIVPAGSGEERCVVNGMSASHRNSPYANSGIVVEIHPEDICLADTETAFTTLDPLIGLHFQQKIEHLAWKNGIQPSQAPAQRLQDFVEGRPSKNLPSCSYLPGIVPSRLDQWLPPIIARRLQQGFRDFNKKYPGYLTNDAVILGVESRSSSAVRIPRDKETLMHLQVARLYPCGEGAGYAGGITSSALDGINAALAFAETINK